MAKFKKKLKSGKIIEFDIATYEQLTGSADFNARRRVTSNKQRIPFQLQRGDQSKDFKKSDIQPIISPVPAPQIIKLDENLNYIAMARADYTASMFRKVLTEISGANARRAVNIPVSIFNEIKSKISTRGAQLPPVVMLLAEDTPFTGSYNIKTGSGFAYSGIANSLGYIDRTINNDSPTATGATWSFANTSSVQSTFVNGTNGNALHQSEYTQSFVIRTWASASYSGSHIESSQFSNPFHSQSRIDSGKFYNYKFHTPSASLTGSVENISTAGYYRTILKANVFGDGNETLFPASFNNPASALYAADREILTFPYDVVVASGGFFHCDRFEVLVGVMSTDALAYRPIRRTTLYWASGSGGLEGATGTGLSGSISPVKILPDSDSIQGIESGSHIFLDAKLSRPASGGYYTTGTPTGYPGALLPVQDPNSHGISWTAAADRIDGGLVTGHVIHIAGRGINDYTKFGDEYFETPFVDAHSQTTPLLRAACQWNGMSFTAGKDTGELSPGDYDDTGDN